MMKKLINNIFNKVCSIGQKSSVWFEKMRLYIFDTRAIKHFVDNNIKLDKQYKKDIKEYWSKYKNVTTKFHKMYLNINGQKDVRFIPDNFYYQYIDYYYNKWKFAVAIADKNYYDMLFKQLNRPKTIIKNVDDIFYDDEYNILNLEEAIDKVDKALQKNDELIIKPTIESQGGLNVKIINKNTILEKELKEYKNNFIIQELVKQSKELEKIHKESVNTVRVISFLYNNNVIILSSILRMGRGG